MRWLPVVVLVLGCGGEEGPAEVPLSAFCERWAAALCESATRCRCGEAIAGLDDACPEAAAAACPLAEGTGLSVLVDEGSVPYDGAAAGRLVAAIEDVSCGDAPACASSEACIGLSGEGGPCGTNHGCAPGLSCASGRCVAAGGLGDRCREGAECASSRCEDGACVEKAADGTACTEDPECASGRCDFSTGRCRAPEPLEGLCTEHTDCETGYCDRDRDIAAGNCRARLADGEACDEDRQCLGGACIDARCAAAICAPLG